MALDVGGLNDAIVSTELAFRSWVEQGHVFEWATAHQDTSLTRDWASLRLDRVNGKADLIILVDLLKLGLALLLSLCERQDWDVVWINSACNGPI